MTLAGVSGAHTDRVLQKIDEYVRFKRDELAGVLGSSFSPADIASWEAADPRNLYLPNHIAIGTNFGGVVWLFDTRTHRSDGEMSLVYWTVDYGVWEERGLEDFPHLLEWASSMADSALKRLRDKVKKSATTGRQGKKRER